MNNPFFLDADITDEQALELIRDWPLSGSLEEFASQLARGEYIDFPEELLELAQAVLDRQSRSS